MDCVLRTYCHELEQSYGKLNGTYSSVAEHLSVLLQLLVRQKKVSRVIAARIRGAIDAYKRHCKIDDREVEGTESVLVELVPPRCPQENSLSNDCYRLGENASAGIRLFDNDRDRNLAPKVAIVKPRTRAVFHAPADVGVGVEAVGGRDRS